MLDGLKESVGECIGWEKGRVRVSFGMRCDEGKGEGSDGVVV
jgi:hypothetical protein